MELVIIILRCFLLYVLTFYTGFIRDIKKNKSYFWVIMIICFLNIMSFEYLEFDLFRVLEVLILVGMFKAIYDINYTEAFNYSLIFYIIREGCYFLLSRYSMFFLDDVLKNIVAICLYFIVLKLIRIDVSNFYKNKRIKFVLVMWFDLVSGLVLIERFPGKIEDFFFLYLLNLIIIHFYNIDKVSYSWKDKCDELTSYSLELEGKIINYRKEVHEHRNELIIIKSLLEKDGHLKNYLANLISLPEDITVCELSNLTFPGVKNFIQYKVNDLKNIGCSLEIYVEPSLANIDLDGFNLESERILYIVLGVVLDNMIDACKENGKKLISIVITKKGNVIDGTFANYCENDVNILKLGEVGYSSKGMDRGIGLSYVKDVLKDNKVVSMKTELVDNFFVQHVYFDLTAK